MWSPKQTLKICFFVSFIVEALIGARVGWAQTDKDLAPIHYNRGPALGRVAKLIQKIENGETELEWDQNHGWLPSLLEKLAIYPSSQTLVFSKTSQQIRNIRPSKPRALYFNDDAYVGYVIAGDFIEIAAVDPQQGARFYVLDQNKTEHPILKTASTQCFSCHENRRTKQVPGFLVRSVFPKRSGHPDLRLETTVTDHTTPLKRRFGGWYVTGQHGSMRHRGNVTINRDYSTGEDPIDREAGANLKELPKIANAKQHLQPSSDIVALMLLEHQSQFHNLITQASYAFRQSAYHDQQMNKIFERPQSYRSETTKRRIERTANELVAYLLFANEYQFESPISGSEKFIADFSSNAIKTADGRSLRDLDLNKRLLKYPCSYLIYSRSYVDLPAELSALLKTKITNVLTGEIQDQSFDHLSDSDRRNILDILRETHPHFMNESVP